MVKRSEAGMITNPVTCGPDATVADVEELCARFRISGVPVTGPDGTLVGIVTNRDIRFESDHRRRVTEVMTPMPLVTAPVGVTRPEALALLGSTRSRSCRWSMGPGGCAASSRSRTSPKARSSRAPPRTPRAAGRRRGRRGGRGRQAPGAGSHRRRRRLPRRGYVARPRPGGHRHDHAGQGQRPGRRDRRQRGHAGRRPGAHRCRRGRGEGGSRARLDLHHPGRDRGGRAAGPAIYEAARRRARERAGDRRRRPAVLRRHRQGDRRRGRHRHAGRPARRVRGGAGRNGHHSGRAVQAVPGDGLARRDAEQRARRVLLQGQVLPGRRAA